MTAKKLTITVTLLCLAGAPASAEQNQPPAPTNPKSVWQWTDEERFAARFAPGSADVRVAEHGKPQRSPAVATSFGHDVQDIIDGHAHPELFLPIEVFHQFVDSVFHREAPPPPARERFADQLLSQAASSGLPDLKPLLARESAAYLDLRGRHFMEIATLVEVRSKRGNVEADELIRQVSASYSQRECRAMYLAFRGVSQALGENQFQVFLQFLYERVAPSMMFVRLKFEDPPETALRNQVGGCQ